MIAPTLFDLAPSIPSPLCVYTKPCPRAGRAELGEPEHRPGCVNTPITCRTCGATGTRSENREITAT